MMTMGISSNKTSTPNVETIIASVASLLALGAGVIDSTGEYEVVAIVMLDADMVYSEEKEGLTHTLSWVK